MTEFVFCGKCLDAALEFLTEFKDELGMLWGYRVKGYPIIAGFIKTSAPGLEIDFMKYSVVDGLEKRLCCPLTISVIGEMGYRAGAYRVEPGSGPRYGDVHCVGEGGYSRDGLGDVGRVCRNCGKEFQGSRGSAYCSPECSYGDYQERMNDRRGRRR